MGGFGSLASSSVNTFVSNTNYLYSGQFGNGVLNWAILICVVTLFGTFIVAYALKQLHK